MPVTRPLFLFPQPGYFYTMIPAVNNYPLLQIKDLSISFDTPGGTVNALQHVSVEVNRNEIVAIVGESGSGKSVTSLSILQLLPSPRAKITQGEILFSPDGEQRLNLLQLPAEEIRKVRGNQIAMIFQEPMTSLNPVFTCGEQITEAIRLHRKLSYPAAREKTIELFEKVKLPEPAQIFQRYPHQLSGGQKQRVMIAMAISCNPALLIADEPTTALDVSVQKNILLLIKELQKQYNMGVFFITHDLGVVAEIADKVVVMYKGNIVEQGTAADVLGNPVHPYTKGLLACRPVLHTKGEKLPVVSDFMQADEDGTIITKEGYIKSASAKEPQVENNAEPASPLLKVQHLKVWFTNKRKLFSKQAQVTKAVDDVNFEVYKGETVGLVGESGCGKTTLGRAMLQLVKPTGGKIIFKQQDLAGLTTSSLHSVRKNMQLVFQDPYSSLNPVLTIGHALTEPLKVHRMLKNDKERKDKAITLLEKVDLSATHFNRYPHQFSGGQRQRIVIARALMCDPSFIVFDESVSSLDVSVQAQVLNLLNDLKREFQFTAVFISHDLSVVHYISDRIIVMNKGKIEESGSSDEVFYRPKALYTQQLINAILK